MKIGTFIFLVVLFSSIVSASLGISPAIVEIDYITGEEYEIEYTITSANPNTQLEIYAAGDLSDYVELSKEETIGRDTFKVRIKLPDEIEKPGEHRISIGIREKISEERFIGTAIDISGAIKIFVPYPGRYVESRINIPDGNINENIPVEVYVINRGIEYIKVNVNVQFFNGGGDRVYDMPFTPVFLNSTNDRFFRKFLDTSDFEPGDYIAQAIIDYGDEIKVNKTFRIGSLYVNITNFTKMLPQGGIQRFLVGVKSMWNDNLEEVFADVVISNTTDNITLRTPSVNLAGWEYKELVGFLDTTKLEGEYEADMTLYYKGEKSFASGSFFVFKTGLSTKFLIIGVISILIIVLVVLFILRLKRRKFRFRRRR